ncbi:ureidoglycolate hydrolase [Pyronema domesticum]|uniref:Similar to Probable ureidoglycolate hydrolase acc. no. O13843 n=1 Tax=Pyronema omphalodes (strain CBS 100304) TaxID=1076935 RepID=U4LQG6_PYROM|nr:ureidoglycolate hydrolase [Pyronema domesticum]CCX29551.1 Similar to Probable ureidoglycolate hydrolase; acc. no. O13843 [Pyronema omphalodes CBS 100304]
MPIIHNLPAPSLPVLSIAPLTPEAFAPFGTVVITPQTGGITVNQGSATKHPRISPLHHSYPASSPPATTNMNLFQCRPRSLPLSGIFNCQILERHPYTTQTFIPMAAGEEGYIVIVAPTGTDGWPVLGNMKAFKAEKEMAVTYGKGTWHAPMVVLEKETKFVVVNGENGVGREDCEEVTIGGEGVKVKVREGNFGLWERAKL